MRYFLEIQYLGTHYHGWQIQPDAISVQEVIQKAMSTLLRVKTEIIGAGRTDAGVHAKQLFAHFDVKNELDIKLFKDRLNAFLPKNVHIKSIKSVNTDAHARFDAIARSYEYYIYLGRNPFLLETTWQLHSLNLDIDKMNEAATILLDYTNFKCFSKNKTDVFTYDCAITEAYWKLDNNTLIFYITANRFLRNMVRAIVGTLYQVGIGKITKNQFIEILKSQDRSKAGFSVPAKGLFLTKVEYPNSVWETNNKSLDS